MHKHNALQASMLVTADLPTVAFGLYHIASALKEEGASCFIHKFSNIINLFDDIREYSVGVVGFSVHWHSQLIASLKIAEQVKAEFSEINIVLGGITASYFAKDLIRFGQVDFVIVGDGEIPFLNIVQDEKPPEIPNLYWKTADNEIRFNGVSYNAGVERMRDFVYENVDDFRNTRSILKMGKGCFFKCLHCGGRNKALKGCGTDQPVFFKPQDIKHVVERNYEKLKFKHLYLAQDHFRDVKNLAIGLAALHDDITGKFTINVGAWGMPDKEYVKILCEKFPKVCLELTFDLVNKDALKNSRGLCFDGEDIENEISHYLQELFAFNNLEIVIFFSYPHLVNNHMVFPDFRTIKAILDWEDLFRQEHLEGRFGICYLLLSTDPGSVYAAKYSFKEFWENMLHMKSGFGSFCFHFREFMDEDEFRAHHFFIQVFMKLLEISTNVVQYLYRITFHSDIEKFYWPLFRVFEELYRSEIVHETKVMQSYANSQAYFGYSCLDQENVGEQPLSNFIFRFLSKCLDKGLLDRDFELIRCLYHSRTRVKESPYVASLDYAEDNAGKEKNSRRVTPIMNPHINLFNGVKNINFLLSSKLLEARSSYLNRESEALFALFAEFSLKELLAIFDENDCSRLEPDMFAIIETGFPGFSPSTKDSVSTMWKTCFKPVYLITKSYDINNLHYIEPILKLLITVNGRDELKNLMDRIQGKRWNALELKSNHVNYAVTEKNPRLIPLTDEELFILNHCNGISSLLGLSQICFENFSMDITVFDTIIEFFYRNRLIL
ncbi:MAG: cobalamin-dependent protein [Candidatus Anammoxibacter sp.]